MSQNGNPTALMSKLLTECEVSPAEERELKKHQTVVLQSLGRTLASINVTPGIYQLAGVKNHARIDERNAAMSTTAELLGVSNVLCRSQMVRCVDEEGKLVEGTFMADAGGEDIDDPDPKCALLDEDDPMKDSMVPETVAQHYSVLTAHGGDCIGCGACEKRCPFVSVRR